MNQLTRQETENWSHGLDEQLAPGTPLSACIIRMCDRSCEEIWTESYLPLTGHILTCLVLCLKIHNSPLYFGGKFPSNWVSCDNFLVFFSKVLNTHWSKLLWFFFLQELSTPCGTFLCLINLVRLEGTYHFNHAFFNSGVLEMAYSELGCY